MCFLHNLREEDIIMKKVYSGVNWNKEESLYNTFWNQQWRQFWLPEEVAVSKDIKQWKQFDNQETYKKVFAGLTMLDTLQTGIGMNKIVEHVKSEQAKAVFSAFGSFEAIHAKSYSYIFTTLCTNQEIDEVFAWIEKNEFLQFKANKIADVYNSIKENDDKSLYKALFASVMLESFLFYSGFFYPLYLGGHGTLKNSAEVISLILRDESLHGVAVGYEAQQLLGKLNSGEQDELKTWGFNFLLELYANEMKYTEDLYAETGLSGKVKAYVRYNANKALMNLGLDTMFQEEEIDPIVMTGIRTDSVTHDFFSQKGNSYALAKVKPITDDTFNFKGFKL